MPEIDNTGTEEENFSFKKWEKMFQMFQETSVEWSNGSEAVEGELQLLEWPEESWKSNPYFFDEKTFWHIFKKQNDWIATFGNDVS